MMIIKEQIMFNRNKQQQVLESKSYQEQKHEEWLKEQEQKVEKYLKETRFESKDLEQAIEQHVKKSCEEAVDLIEGAQNIKIILEKNHPQRAELNEIGFQKNGKNYIVQMYIGTTYNDKAITKATSSTSYEQLLHGQTSVKIIDADTNTTIWDSQFWDDVSDIKYDKGLSKHELSENINVAKAAYVISALRSAVQKHNVKSKMLEATAKLRAEGYNHKPFYAPEYVSDERK